MKYYYELAILLIVLGKLSEKMFFTPIYSQWGTLLYILYS